MCKSSWSRVLVCVVALLYWQPGDARAQCPIEVSIDGLDDCTEYAGLVANWVEVPLGPYPTCITLESSDFGASFDTENRMAFVMADALGSEDEDYWLFTLNGIGDAVTVTAGRVFVGFVDTGVSDNHGSSTLESVS